MKTRPKVYPPARGWLDDDDENDGDDDDNGDDDGDDDYEDIKLTSCCLWVEGRRDRWRWLTDTARCILLLIFSLFPFFHLISEKENTEWQTQLSVFWSPFFNFFLPFFYFKKEEKNRVAKCHGYDGYIRVKILAGWGKSLGEHENLAQSSLLGGRFVQD